MSNPANAARGLCGGVLALFPLAAAAQPEPYGVLIADTALEALFFTRDWNGDGDADDPGEATVYFDGTNASGLPSPRRIVGMTRDFDEMIVDAASRSVVALRDENHDGDANDAGEARVWFSEAGNTLGLAFDTPVGFTSQNLWTIGVVLANAPAGGAPAIYAAEDRNHDGDAQDAGDIQVFADIAALFPGSTLRAVQPVARVWRRGDGNAVLVALTTPGRPDALWVLRNEDFRGVVEPRETHLFLEDGNPFGVVVGGAMGNTHAIGGVHLLEPGTPLSPRRLWHLVDADRSGRIDQPQEARVVWSDDLLPPPWRIGPEATLDVWGTEGRAHVSIASGGAPEERLVARLVDLDLDGAFTGPGETAVWAGDHGPGGFVESARAPLFVTGCYADCDQGTGPGRLDIFDFLCFQNAYAAEQAYACDCDSSSGPAWCDIFDFLCFNNAFAQGCP